MARLHAFDMDARARRFHESLSLGAAVATILTAVIEIGVLAWPTRHSAVLMIAHDQAGRPCQGVSLSRNGSSIYSDTDGVMFVPSAWLGRAVNLSDVASGKQLGSMVLVDHFRLVCPCKTATLKAVPQ